MLENFSSLVEFFAAVYVTMTINNDYCENFWTPQYYKEMEHLLDKFKFNTSSTSNKELINAIKTTYQKIQGNARRRGAVMLWFCVMVLIYIGFEDDNAICAKAIIHYKPLFYSQSILLLIVLFPNYLMKSWRWVSFWIFTITVFYALVKYTDIGLYFDNSLLEWGYSSSKSILLGMLLFPVLYQTLLFWEYSRMYKGYLGNKVQIEYEKYTKSLAGIQTGDKDKVDPEYKSVYGDYIITNRSNEDNSLEQFNKLLYSRLLNAVTSVNSAGGGNVTQFKNWFQALDSMKQQISQIDFDIALLGCEAYAFPLGAYIKGLGKQAITVCGALQTYFGVYGNRKEELPERNEYWIRPNSNTRLKGYEKIERVLVSLTLDELNGQKVR